MFFEIALTWTALESVATPDLRARRGFSRLIRRNQRSSDLLHTLAVSQYRRVVHLPVGAGPEQMVGEPPDIVDKHTVEVEQPNPIVPRKRLREEIALDRLVLVFDLPAAIMRSTEHLRLDGPDLEVGRKFGRYLAA